MADRVIQRNDTAARWQSINPILAKGEMGIISDGARGYKIGDGVNRWNDLPYPANPASVVQELGDSETAVISQKKVTEELNNNRLNQAFSNKPAIDFNHVFSINSDGTPGSYVNSLDFDTAWVQIFENSGLLQISNTNITRVVFFSDLIPSEGTHISHSTSLTPSIPENAQLALISLRRTDNPNGYKELRVLQDGSGVTRIDLSIKADRFSVLPDRSFSGIPNIDSNHFFDITGGVNIYRFNVLFDAAWIYINSKTNLKITGAVIIRTSFFNDLIPSGDTFISYSTSLTPSIPENARLALINLRKSDNPDGYKDLRVLQDGSGVNRIELAETNSMIGNVGDGLYQYPEGNNYLNPDNNLLGYTVSSGQYIEYGSGILSNRLFLSKGKRYTIQGVKAYAANANNYIAYFTRNGQYINRSVHATTDGVSHLTYNPPLGTHHARLVLRGINTAVYDPNAAQLEEGDNASVFETYTGTLFSTEPPITLQPSVSVLKNILLTGASFAYSGNTWFDTMCDKLAVIGYNKAVSGELIRHTAQKLYEGTLYTEEEFENFGIFLIFHSHNHNVYNEEAYLVDYNDYVLPFPATTIGYQQAWDYTLKKYAADCYAAKDNPYSKWYGTKNGKPYIVVVCTHWHDARSTFADSIRLLRNKWGFHLIELDNTIGFSKNQLHPVTDGQVSLLHAVDSEVIDNITYGWHPDRTTGAYIQNKIADVIAANLITI